ncbi:MAG TPA: A/G-specific adenine glycosylase [Polyangia bacterium]|nr:A/G-specific adenine glycosylase [Polyangia bacterium]
MRIAEALLQWYDGARRELPWRREASPYRTLVSELMAQQTTLAVVVPYFERFLARFPTLGSLAAASDEDVMALWSGLGYYARARNLRRAAVTVVAEHGGALPPTVDELRRLPGIGPYTAAAVASIAFGARAFALDGNGARVMARLFGVADPIDRPGTRARLQALGAAEVPEGRPGDFNQAVMELGALICTPRNPRCEGCPVGAVCAARARGLSAVLPVRSPKAARPIVRVACACITDGARVLLVRRGDGLLSGTWTLPERELGGPARRKRTESSAALADALAAARGLAGDLGVRPTAVVSHGVVRQIFTHRDVRAEVFRVQVGAARRLADAPGAGRDTGDVRWLDPAALAEVGLSSFARKTVALGLGQGLGQKRDTAALRP